MILTYKSSRTEGKGARKLYMLKTPNQKLYLLCDTFEQIVV